jgi:hypothetical protein
MVKKVESTDRNEDREEPSRRGEGIVQPLRQEGRIEQNGQKGIFGGESSQNAVFQYTRGG